MVTLKTLSIGETATIKSLDMEDKGLKCRFLEMGFCPKSCVQKICVAPLGGTCIYKIKDCNIAVRDENADDIIVF